jgi:hypothetical protein
MYIWAFNLPMRLLLLHLPEEVLLHLEWLHGLHLHLYAFLLLRLYDTTTYT